MGTSAKKPLNFSDYEKYSIPQEYSAFIISFSNISEKEAEDFEYEYSTKGYKIFNSSLEYESEGSFQLELIVAKLEMLF